MKMGELNVEIEICCRAEFITYACEILRKSVKVFCRFLNFFTERGEKRVSGFQSSSCPILRAVFKTTFIIKMRVFERKLKILVLLRINVVDKLFKQDQ